MEIIALTSENFDSVLRESQTPVLVDFWADWCGPCKMFSPIVERFAQENEGKVTVGKVNVDEQQELAMRFRVMSIPTAILFQNGEEAGKLIGLQPQEALEGLLR